MNLIARTQDGLPNSSILWLTWEKQQRNRSLAARMGASLVELDESGGTLIRYARCIIKSIGLLFRWRGRLVVVQNPSIVLSLLAVCLRPVFKFRLVVDAHNAGVHPSGRWTNFLIVAIKFIVRHADWIVVTNENLATYIRSIGGRPLVLPDPLPEGFFECVSGSDSVGKSVIDKRKRVLFICTWAADEPYCEVIASANLLPDAIIYITGASKGREAQCSGLLPENIELTGYLSDDEYHRMLCSADVVIDLTTREDCLVCGAYEAVAAGKPFVLSNTATLRAYFHSGGVHADNNALAIATSVKAVLEDYPRFKRDVTEFKTKVEMEWTAGFEDILEELTQV